MINFDDPPLVAESREKCAQAQNQKPERETQTL